MFITLWPHLAKYTNATKRSRFVMNRDGDWRTEPLLCNAPVAIDPWLQLRNVIQYADA